MEKPNIKNKIFSFFKLDLIHELIFSAIGCISFTFLFFFFPDKCWNYPYRNAIIGILTLCFFIVFLVLNQTHPRKKFFKVNYKRNIILFSIFNYVGLCFLYFNTYFTTNGILGDNFYRTAYVTKMAYSGYPQDCFYKDLSPFFSPLYWYILALISRLFNIPPYRMLKLGMLFIAYLNPIILFEVWKKIYAKKIAFIIAILSVLFLYDPYSPDHLLSVLFIIPFIMYYLENCTNKKFSKRNYIIGGLYGAIIFCTYFLFFLIIPIYYLIALIQDRKKFIDNFKHIFFITIFLMLFSCWFWLPLLKDILLLGFESHQNRYFNESVLRLPIKYILEISIIGIFHFLGFIYIVRKYKSSEDMKILGNLLLSIFIIYIIGLFGVLFHNPIAHIRFIKAFYYILIISSSIFYVKLAKFIKNKVLLKKYEININISQVWIYILVVIIFSRGFALLNVSNDDIAYQAANEEDVRYDLIDIIDELDYEDKVFLTPNKAVAAYRPIYLFLYPNPYFSHPSALYNERVKFLIKLSECETSKEFYEEFMDSKFEPIDYFWLDIENSSDIYSDYVFAFAIEEFPEGREYYEIIFKWELFNNPKYFKRHEIDGEIIYETKK